MAGVVVHVTNARDALELHALLEQVLMNIHDATAGEDLVELIASELVVAGATRDHHGFNVEVVERIGHSVEENTVVGDDLLGLVELTRPPLRIAAAQIARWQYGLHTKPPEHGLGGEPHLREEPLRAAAWEVEDRLGLARGSLRVSNDRHVLGIFNIEQGPGRLLRQLAGHFLVHKMNHLLAQWGQALGCRGLGGLGLGKLLK